MNIKNFLFLVVLVPWAANAGTMSAIFSDTITNIFIFINIVLTIFFAFIRFDRFSVVHGPEVLTTIGILGCFVGIASSLLHFDASNVSESVPHLLEGVKTAFLASLSGVFGSLVIRARHYFQKKPIQQSSGAPKAATLDDVVSATQELQRSLSGNAEGSLLSQLKLIRQEQSDELLALRKSFESFSEKMAKDSSETLIEALKGVIKDFNEKIGEQFGENFKHLNAGVEKLVVWQQQYKEELDKLQILQKSSADDLNNASAGLALFIDRASNFADTAEALEITLKGLAYQHEQIENSQASLTEVLLQMKGVIPQFSQKIDEMADSMSKGVAKVQNEINEIMKGFGVQVQSTSSEMKQLLTETLRKSQNEFNESLKDSMDSVRQSVITLDKGLQEELTKSLESLGRQLASLSEKFVSDYTPLTERLREVVQIAAVK
ncbi:membrane protein [Pantoea stewartii]|uniref:membrane protein n=1 Tax=Pantoea TaxID=53335 RepID=UPI000541E1DC|nr:membrane protein [Pantoea stewartii]KHE02046.1 membrane protein [Pantoea stewartii]KHN64404.1 membrane protein [Pantoea stewartii]